MEWKNAALRYLYEKKPGLHVIAAGSLLEFALSEISFPVGRVQFLNMHPMTFAEFLLAGGHEQLFQILGNPPCKLDDFVHKVPSVKQPSIPLGSIANTRKFKAALIDIGLMQRLNHLPIDREINQFTSMAA